MSALISSSSVPSSEAGRLLEVARHLSTVPDLTRRKRQVYTLWIVGYYRFLDKRNLGDPRPKHLQRFLKSLRRRPGADDAMREQAAEALVFFHEVILDQKISEVNGRLDMMSAREREDVLRRLQGTERLLARLVFATQLDLSEALRLRVGDVDLTRGQIVVSDASGCSDRFASLPDDLTQDLEAHLRRVQRIHDRDVAQGHGVVPLPKAVEEQFPGSGGSWMWQYVFPSDDRTLDLRSGRERRYPMQPTRLLSLLEKQTAPMTRAFSASASPSPTPDSERKRKEDADTDVPPFIEEDAYPSQEPNFTTWSSVYS